MNTIELSGIADGAVDERFNLELEKVIQNLQDLNTDPTKTRKIVLTATFKGNAERDLVNVDVQAKTTLAPAVGVTTRIMIGNDEKGKPIANELKSGVPGQMFVSEDGEVLDDKGEPVPSSVESSNVVNFK